MARPKRTFRVNGIKMTGEEWAKRYKITTNAFLQRILAGWKMKEDMMVAPSKKEYEIGANLPVSNWEHRELQEGFGWDNEDDGVCW